MDTLIHVILIGVGATAVMDLWSLLRKQLLNMPITNWAMVGRWIAYIPQGQFHHHSIAARHGRRYCGVPHSESKLRQIT